MLELTKNKVAISKVNSKMEGVFATEMIKESKVVFVDEITVFHNHNEQDKHVPMEVLLTGRIMEFPDNLVKVGNLDLRSDLWNLKPGKEDKKYLRLIADEFNVPLRRVKDIYNLVCAYNTRTYLLLNIDDGMAEAQARIEISNLLSKANHSCVPNSKLLAIDTIDKFRERKTGLVAIEDIAPSDQITWNYTAKNLPSDVKERRRRLKKDYGFVCQCSRCNAESRN